MGFGTWQNWKGIGVLWGSSEGLPPPPPPPPLSQCIRGNQNNNWRENFKSPCRRWGSVIDSWKWKLLSRVQLFATPWTIQSMEFSRPEILEWVAFPFSRGSSHPRDQTQVSHIAGRFFTIWTTREAQEYWSGWPIPSPGDLPDPGIEPGSPVLQADSLPTYQRSPIFSLTSRLNVMNSNPPKWWLSICTNHGPAIVRGHSLRPGTHCPQLSLPCLYRFLPSSLPLSPFYSKFSCLCLPPPSLLRKS